MSLQEDIDYSERVASLLALRFAIARAKDYQTRYEAFLTGEQKRAAHLEKGTHAQSKEEAK